MWKEIITIKDFESLAVLRNEFGCSINYTAERMLFNIENKIDCHYFFYDTPNIKLIHGFKKNEDNIMPIAFTVICEEKDYPEALRIMGQHTKDYLEANEIKTLLIFTNKEELNNYNIGIAKIGSIEFYRIMKEEYEKLGLNIDLYADKIEARL